MDVKEEMIRLRDMTLDQEVARVTRRGIKEIERLRNIIRRMRGICETAERG